MCVKKKMCSFLSTERLQENRTVNSQRRLYGYMCAYLASIYGHRAGVFQNMTVAQVKSAKHNPKAGTYLINVSANFSSRV